MLADVFKYAVEQDLANFDFLEIFYNNASETRQAKIRECFADDLKPKNFRSRANYNNLEEVRFLLSLEKSRKKKLSFYQLRKRTKQQIILMVKKGKKVLM